MFGFGQRRPRLEDPRSLSEHRKTLLWIGTMITGNAEGAEHSLVDATGLSEASGTGFRGWLVEWAERATARAAVNSVRSSIRELSENYSNLACSHRKHEFLSADHVQLLQQANVQLVTEQLDVVARTVLVLYGCQRLSFSDCTLLMNLPLQSVVGAYCRARQWFTESFLKAERIRNSSYRCLHEVRHDPDGVPVWG